MTTLDQASAAISLGRLGGRSAPWRTVGGVGLRALVRAAGDRMAVTSAITELPPTEVTRLLEGLPPAEGYDLHVKYLRYREKPHLSAWTDFSDRSITLQVPEPFLPFGEIVPYGAMRRPGAGTGRLRFIWLTEGVTFRERREVLRFLYCHEWMHVFGSTRTGGRKVGEIRCDRFALFNYLKDSVTVEDAEESLRWKRPT